MKKILLTVIDFLRDSAQDWGRANGSMLAAGLAYYTIFSLAPLLVIIVNVAGLVLGPSAAEGMLVDQIGGVVTPQVAETIENAIENLNEANHRGVSTVISAVITLIGASMMFVQLKRAINFLWGLAPEPGQGLFMTLRTQLLSFGMVIFMGVLTLVVMGLSAMLLGAMHYLQSLAPGLEDFLPQINFGPLFLVFLGLFLITFKYLPDAHIVWKDVWLGASITALLFTVGEFLIGAYLGMANLGSTFGAASSMVLILFWIYYSMQIILFGAKLTQKYADRFGSGITPSQKAHRFERRKIEPG
jgi:membrane protein